MVGTLQGDPAPTRRAPVPKDVKRAIDYLRSGIGRKVTTADLVAASGVAERTLRKHFRDFVGISPLSYLRRLRLAAVRDELIGGAEAVSITEVAIRHGFDHLGRFSLDYRRRFGESPSETVRKSRGEAERSAGCGQLRAGIGRAREKPSIAVLPLDGRATEPTIRNFAAAASEKIAITLARTRSISVVLPAPSWTRGADPRLSSISRARYLLAGRTAQSGGRLRVILRLVDTVTAHTIWGDSYDGEVADPFALQDRVAEGVARAIVRNIRSAEIDLARRRRVEDLDPYGLAMRAYPLALASNPEAARRALELLDRAMEIDPDYALPPALAAWCHAQLVLHNGTPEPAAEKAQALLLAQRAGILDHDDPLVLTARCAVHTMAREFDVADAILARVLASEPHSAWVWERSGWLKTLTGEAETAIQHFRRAISLDHSGASNANRFVGLGSAHFHAGRYDEGALWMRQALLDQPATAWVNRTLAVSYARIGERAAARDSLAAFRTYFPDATIGAVIASIPFTPDFLDRVAEGLDDLGLPL
jgi:TolB-like protein/Flp pilus assembly protein TadD